MAAAVDVADADALLQALYPAAAALALTTRDLLSPRADLSASQLEAIHDILNASTRRVVERRISLAARHHVDAARP